MADFLQVFIHDFHEISNRQLRTFNTYSNKRLGLNFHSLTANIDYQNLHILGASDTTTLIYNFRSNF